ncbi:MAG: (deoxy)nucleoside triphosphate pyrophosphohydrolase [Lachnospiraceae bacterium]|nr:(deoxy)nucleoside triphosphate pyrophosphohydrolase [Lachnospiraceae bacterium]
MEIYKVDRITEADFGCEETEHKTPTALLRLISEADETIEKSVEVPENALAEKGISEGKRVCFTESGEILKYIRVVAAVIRDTSHGEDKIFSTARGYGTYKGWWEFPGGKIEKDETPEQALVREIHEELTADIKVGELIKTIEYDYPEFHLSMDCFWAKVVNGRLILKEAEAAKWLSRDEIDSVSWLPADKELVERIKEIWK